MTCTLVQLNAMDDLAFVDALGAIYEHSPWVAEQALAARPFASLDELLRTMQSAVASASHGKKLALICAHPELQGKPAKTELTADSKLEQKSAGLDQCTPLEIEQLSSLNRAYREKFGFPFVIAVRGLTRHDIIASMTHRLSGDGVSEFDACLAEIDKIARLRLVALFQ